MDAAWAGTSGLLPEMQHYFEGLDQVGGVKGKQWWLLVMNASTPASRQWRCSWRAFAAG